MNNITGEIGLQNELIFSYVETEYVEKIIEYIQNPATSILTVVDKNESTGKKIIITPLINVYSSS